MFCIAQSINNVDEIGKTALDIAFCCNVRQQPPQLIINQLASPAVNINHQDTTGETLLHEAVYHQWWDLVPLLIQHGADINLANTYGQTALFYVLTTDIEQEPPQQIIKQLISSRNITMLGDSMVDVAVEREWWILVSLFIQHGAEVCLQTVVKSMKIHKTDVLVQLIMALAPVTGTTVVDFQFNRRTTSVRLTIHHLTFFTENQLVDAIFHLLMNTCQGQVKLTHNSEQHISEKCDKLQLLRASPVGLKQLSVWAIRSSMTTRCEESFQELGLPSALMSLVSYHKLAEDIIASITETS